MTTIPNFPSTVPNWHGRKDKGRAYRKTYYTTYSFGTMDHTHIPNIHCYEDLDAYYRSVKPMVKGVYKGLVPFGSRTHPTCMWREKNSICIGYKHPRLVYLKSKGKDFPDYIIRVWKDGRVEIKNEQYSDASFKTIVHYLFHFEFAVIWNPASRRYPNKLDPAQAITRDRTLSAYTTIRHKERTYSTTDPYLKFKLVSKHEDRVVVSVKGQGLAEKVGGAEYMFTKSNTATVKITLDTKKKNKLVKQHKHFIEYCDMFMPLVYGEASWLKVVTPAQYYQSSYLGNPSLSRDKRYSMYAVPADILDAIQEVATDKKYCILLSKLRGNNPDVFSEVFHKVHDTVVKLRRDYFHKLGHWSKAPEVLYHNFATDIISIVNAKRILSTKADTVPPTKTNAWYNNMLEVSESIHRLTKTKEISDE
tara:strand:+ start:4953 stop:6209 length:1257 start_codon:yes stop_codon:yes gene_type:complete